MKKFSGLFLLIVIANCANAQGLTKYGEITSTGADYIGKNGSIGGNMGINKNGKQITAIIPSVLNPTTGKIWMDRNLGATKVATSSTDSASYGYLYQWGRGADGHQIRTSDATPTLSSADAPGHGSFITTSANPYDWRSPQNNSLWQGVDGINNPCPSGYRLPTNTELNNERLSWVSKNAAGAIASPLKLPMAGYRVINGQLSGVGNGGYYWTSTVTGANAQFLSFNSSKADMFFNTRAFGFSVRCLKD